MMTSRERIQRLLSRQPVDRIPNGLGGCETAGIHILAYNKLKKILGVHDPRTRLDTFMSNAIVEPSVLERMSGDIILLGSPLMNRARFWGCDTDREWKDQTLWGTTIQIAQEETFTTDEEGNTWWGERRCPPGGIYFDRVPSAIKDEFNLDVNQPSPDDYNPSHDIPDEKLRMLEESARWLYENTEYSINCGEAIEDLQVDPEGLLRGGCVCWMNRTLFMNSFQRLVKLPLAN